MANMLFANNCNTTLASSLTSGATSMSVTSATGFPSPTGVQYFYCTLADAATQTTIEIVKVTSVSGTTFAITRAQDGTSATAFAAGAVVSLRLVRASLNDFPKLDETNTFNADQAISGQLTSSAGLATTGTFTATAPSDGLVMDYATGFGRFSAFAGDGFQWYNAGIANTKLMQLSSSGVITTATWNGTTVGTGYGGTGLTSFTSGGLVYASSTSALATGSVLQFNGTNLILGGTSTFGVANREFAINAASGVAGISFGVNGVNTGYMYSGASSMFLTTYGGAYPLLFGTNNTEGMRLDASGNLLVGTTSAVGKITAVGSGMALSAQGGGGAVISQIITTDTTGNPYMQVYYTDTNQNRGSVQYNRGTGFMLYNTTSDARLKKNIMPVGDVGDIIDTIQIVSHDWKQNDAHTDYSVIAQDLYKAVPQAVLKGDDNEEITEIWQVDHSKLVPLLVKEIQTLRSRLKSANIA